MDPKQEERLQSLETLIGAIEGRSAQDFAFRRAIGGLADDLAYLLRALRQTPEHARLNRAFHAVHVPSLLAVMSMLDGVDDMASVTPEDQHQINSSLHRASQLAAEARQRVERAVLDDTKLELEVLADYAPSTAPLEPASLLERAVETSKDTAAAAAGLWRDGVVRAGAVPSLAANLQRSVFGAVSDHVTKPIEMRLQASAQAVKYGVGTGMGIGVVTALLFPPLLPISAGGAVLAAMYGWRTKLDAASALNTAEHETRLAELKAERLDAIAKLTNGASVLQMETDEINLTIDAETGHVDGVILKGAHANRTWTDLTLVEQAEVAASLAEGAEVLISILELGNGE